MSLTHAAYGSTAEAFEIRITGISSCQGKVMLAVYDDESHFMNIEQAVVKEVIDLAPADCASTMLYRVAIPYGQYAVVVYHDANSNGIHDKNMFGAPTETWGVSNNARPLLRAPQFRECVFTHAASRTSVTIEIQ
ncbi:MAG: DUF2141 domain-containing protein [Methylobacter sp.]|nr:MAG: DUF2141 domain-containing protein [Methylobacter sp.]